MRLGALGRRIRRRTIRTAVAPATQSPSAPVACPNRFSSCRLPGLRRLLAVRIEQDRRESSSYDDDPGGHNGRPGGARPQPPLRVRKEEPDDEPERHVQKQPSRNPYSRAVRELEIAQQPRCGNCRHQPPGRSRTGPAQSGHACCGKGEGDREIGGDAPVFEPVAEPIPREGHAFGGDQRKCEDRIDPSGPLGRRPESDGGCHQATSAARAGPESRDFGMNPRAPLAASLVPKSLASRLDVMTTSGPPGASSSRATSNPFPSGSCTSSRTMSGFVRPDLGQSARHVGGLARDLETVSFQESAGERTKLRVIVDDQDALRHAEIVAQDATSDLQGKP